VTNQGNDDQPQTELETHESSDQKDSDHNEHGVKRTTHHGKQDGVRSDHDEQRRIKCPVTIKARQPRQEGHEKGQNDAYDVSDGRSVSFNRLAAMGKRPWEALKQSRLSRFAR
jgi:hypothetical protein